MKIQLLEKLNKIDNNDNKFYLTYLNRLVDQYDNIYHHFVNKKTN